MSKDWYRNKRWNSAIETEFLSKLRRARSQRDQYLVIQALTLADFNPEATLKLVDLYFETRRDDFEDVRALWARAKALLKNGDKEAATLAYRAVLDREDEFPNHLSNAYLEYPYMVATHRLKSEFENALEVLEKNVGRLTFPVDHFKWHASKAIMERDPDNAARALDAARLKTSGFRFHPTVGIVGKEHRAVIKDLRKLTKRT